MTRKISEASEILDAMTGDDPELRQMIADSELRADIARLVYDAREGAALTQQQLADLAGLSASTIKAIEESDYRSDLLEKFDVIRRALNLQIRIMAVPNSVSTPKRARKSA